MYHGIDVSSYQGSINWKKVKKNIDFAIIRCGYGNDVKRYDDVYYKRNVKGCIKENIPFGVYLYSYALDLKMAQSEVEHTLRLIKDYKLNYPVFLDVEYVNQLKLPKEQLVRIVKYYCEGIEKAGYYVGIYASLDTFLNQLESSELESYDKWVAEWGNNFTYRGKSGLWQYSDNLSISGIRDKVDGNIAFYDYPKIMRKYGLNYLSKLKYKVGDKVKVKGVLYNNEHGDNVIHNKIKKGKITKVAESSVAPYEINNLGYVKEGDLVIIQKCGFIKFFAKIFKKFFRR